MGLQPDSGQHLCTQVITCRITHKIHKAVCRQAQDMPMLSERLQESAVFPQCCVASLSVR